MLPGGTRKCDMANGQCTQMTRLEYSCDIRRCCKDLMAQVCPNFRWTWHYSGDLWSHGSWKQWKPEKSDEPHDWLMTHVPRSQMKGRVRQVKAKEVKHLRQRNKLRQRCQRRRRKRRRTAENHSAHHVLQNKLHGTVIPPQNRLVKSSAFTFFFPHPISLMGFCVEIDWIPWDVACM